MAGSCFIETSELSKLITQGTPPVYVIDGTLVSSEDPKAVFQRKRIPSSRYFDQMEIRDKSSAHPLAYPSVSAFRDYMISLQIPNNGSLVVVYDQAGMMSAPRAWFLLTYFGYTNLKFLNGGLRKWESERLPVESGPVRLLSAPISHQDYMFTPRPELIIDYEAVKSTVERLASGRGNELLWDPRNPKITPGTLILHSLNVFYQRMLNDDLTVKSQAEVRAIMKQAGINLEKPIVVTCNRGMMACSGALLLKYVGKNDVVVNRGSWTEWAQRAKL